jgi:hypothetical protein
MASALFRQARPPWAREQGAGIVTERPLDARELGDDLGLSPGHARSFEAGDLPVFRLFGRKGGPVGFRESEIVETLESWRFGGVDPTVAHGFKSAAANLPIGPASLRLTAREGVAGPSRPTIGLVAAPDAKRSER